jgi:hypothetical protein
VRASPRKGYRGYQRVENVEVRQTSLKGILAPAEGPLPIADFLLSWQAFYEVVEGQPKAPAMVIEGEWKQHRYEEQETD